MSNADHADPAVRAETETPLDWKTMGVFMQRMLVTLDGLWFMNVHQALGPQKTMEMDIEVFKGQFKLATRTIRAVRGLDGESEADKVAVFQAMAHLYGHKFEVRAEDGAVTMRLFECAFYENLKKAGRTETHDCRVLCRAIARPWFEEMEPRTGGEGHVDLHLPVGGPYCDWTCRHPATEV